MLDFAGCLRVCSWVKCSKTAKLIELSFGMGLTLNVNHTLNFAVFRLFLPAVQPLRLMLQNGYSTWTSLSQRAMLLQWAHVAKHLCHFIMIHVCHLTGSWQNHTDNRFFRSAVVGWCDWTSRNHSSIFNDRYILVVGCPFVEWQCKLCLLFHFYVLTSTPEWSSTATHASGNQWSCCSWMLLAWVLLYTLLCWPYFW